MAPVPRGTRVLRETVPPQVCSGPGSCCRWDIPGAGDQPHGKLGISVVFQSVELLSFLQDPKLIVYMRRHELDTQEWRSSERDAGIQPSELDPRSALPGCVILGASCLLSVP